MIDSNLGGKATDDPIKSLLKPNSLVETRSLVSHLEEQHGFIWLPVGNRENNYGQINIGSEPGLALIERVTNAIDACIEREALLQLGANEKPPASPREAVEKWFGIADGRLKRMEIQRRQELADNVVVRLSDGSSPETPIVEVRDLGVGLRSSEFANSILGLGEGNKVEKFYLAGAYGQGGSTAFAFSPDGTLIASRKEPRLLAEGEEDEVAVTFVRYSELDPLRNKNGRYEFLVTPSREVPSVAYSEGMDFRPGTLVKHYDYELKKYSAKITQLTGSLWWLLQNALFDPVLPLWAEDARKKNLAKGERLERRSLTGNHSRLVDDSREKVELSGSIELVLRGPGGAGPVQVHFWVLKETEDPAKRSRPIDSYVDPAHPLTYTYFGQTHGTEGHRFIADKVGLAFLTRFMVVQVELDRVNPAARRALFSSTRDRLKEASVTEFLRGLVAEALSQDEDLIRLNEQRRDAVLSRQSDVEREKLRARFARLVEQLPAGNDARSGGKGGEGKSRPRGGETSRAPLPALPTAMEPTFLRLGNKVLPVEVPVDRYALITLESDAPDGYLTDHAHAKFAPAFDPESIAHMQNRSDFRGGRLRVALRSKPEVAPGEEGSVSFFLFSASGSSFSVRVPIRVTIPSSETHAGDRGKSVVKAPEPVPVHRDEWGPLGWDEKSVARVVADSSGVKIFVNMENRHIKKLLDSGGYEERGLSRMSNNYLLYTAFFAFLQSLAVQGTLTLKNQDEFDAYEAQELDRAAQTVVTSIAAEGRLEASQ